MTDFEQRAIISGIGQSDVGRRLNRSGLDLTIDAALAAIADAGLTTDDIDGVATYPGAAMGGPAGFSGPGSPEVQDALRLKVSTRTREGSTPRWSTRSTTASTMVVVLPVPGPASTSRGPPACSTTRRWLPSSTGGGCTCAAAT